jgi:hypothetical protein
MFLLVTADDIDPGLIRLPTTHAYNKIVRRSRIEWVEVPAFRADKEKRL